MLGNAGRGARGLQTLKRGGICLASSPIGRAPAAAKDVHSGPPTGQGGDVLEIVGGRVSKKPPHLPWGWGVSGILGVPFYPLSTAVSISSHNIKKLCECGLLGKVLCRRSDLSSRVGHCCGCTYLGLHRATTGQGPRAKICRHQKWAPLRGNTCAVRYFCGDYTRNVLIFTPSQNGP